MPRAWGVYSHCERSGHDTVAQRVTISWFSPRDDVRQVLNLVRVRGFFCTILLAAASPAFWAQDAASASTSIHLDPLRTTITFSAGSIKRVHGTFQLKGGLFALDSKSGVAQGEILVDAESEKSNDPKLDKKIGGEVLESAKYPGIFFHPEKVTGSMPVKNGEAHLKLEGIFTIHGQDHPLAVDVNAVRTGSEVVLNTQFTVPYVKWGMKDASTLLMRDRDIHLTMESHGTVEALHTDN